jgi:stage II sporulation protein P
VVQILILLAFLLIFTGVGQRVLDRMRLTDAQAAFLLLALLVGSFLPDLPVGPGLRLNLGGAVVPAGVATYLLLTADSKAEKFRALWAALITAALVVALDRLLPADPGRFTLPLLESAYLPGLLAGLVGYLSGRSRRASFVAGVYGVALADLFSFAENLLRRTPGSIASLGAAGFFDAMVLAGFLAVALAELVGETREAVSRGTLPLKAPVAGAGLFLALALAGAAYRFSSPPDEVQGKIYTLLGPRGEVLLETGRRIVPGDRFLDESNRLFQVEKVTGFTARARLLGEVTLPSPSAPPPGKRPEVGIYHSHNDESYIPSSGTPSVNGRGDVHRVGDALAASLKREGFRVTHDESIHLPHDRGAYRRSRSTAWRLLRSGNDLLLDIHRDTGPRASYSRRIEGEEVAQVRIVVGRQNPNFPATDRLARELKAVADRLYPGLVKGIFYGSGAYNQDLAPARTLLLEMGTEETPRESALRGAELLARVIGAWRGGLR